MSLHHQIAVMGIGYGHKLLAVLGFGLSLEVFVKQKDTGGGYYKWAFPALDEFEITFVITHKHNKWKKSFVTGPLGLKSLEKVIATFKSVVAVGNRIKVVSDFINIKIKNILVKADIK